MIPQDLTNDLQELKDVGYVFEVKEEASKVYIEFDAFSIPSDKFSMTTTPLLIFTTQEYPKANFDMFRTDEKLVLKNGSVPQSAEVIDTHLGKRWRRFSYHPYNSKPWNQALDTVGSFIEHVRERFRKGV